MKTVTYSTFFSTIFFAASAFAGSSLDTTCSGFDGKMLNQVTIQNYNFSTINSTFNILTSKSKTDWYSVKASNNGGLLYDIAKTALISGGQIDLCYSKEGNYLLGLQWSLNAN